MGLTEVANNLARTYSGGMIRKLEVACAMLIRPKILLFDEPIIGLDLSARKVVWEELTTFKKELVSASDKFIDALPSKRIREKLIEV